MTILELLYRSALSIVAIALLVLTLVALRLEVTKSLQLLKLQMLYCCVRCSTITPSPRVHYFFGDVALFLAIAQSPFCCFFLVARYSKRQQCMLLVVEPGHGKFQIQDLYSRNAYII